MTFRVAGALPHTTVATFREKAWTIELACLECGRPPIQWTRDQWSNLPAEATIGEIAARLVCACGSRDGTASARQGRWSTPRPERV